MLRCNRRIWLFAFGLAIVPTLWYLTSVRHPSAQQIDHRIAALHRWGLDDTVLWDRIQSAALNAHQPVSEQDWNQLEQAATRNPPTYLYALVIDLPKVTAKSDSRHQDVLKTWAVSLMSTDNPVNEWASLNGYTGYIRTDASDADVRYWRAKLLSRGGIFTDNIPKIDKIANRATSR
jgi:hypothetical protein